MILKAAKEKWNLYQKKKKKANITADFSSTITEVGGQWNIFNVLKENSC